MMTRLLTPSDIDRMLECFICETEIGQDERDGLKCFLKDGEPRFCHGRCYDRRRFHRDN
jgi:hypothetical protein